MKLEIKSLSFGYKSKVIFKNTNVVFKPNEISLIFGDNGVGKSTFFKMLLGDILDYEGTILVNNKNLKELSITDRSFIFSICSASQPNILIKVKEVLNFSSSDNTYTENVIKDFKIENYLEREMQSLSEGEKQWIFLARAFSRNTDCILLDEPTTFLDRKHKSEFIKLVEKYADNKTILINSHDEKLFDIAQRKLFEINNFQIVTI